MSKHGFGVLKLRVRALVNVDEQRLARHCSQLRLQCLPCLASVGRMDLSHTSVSMPLQLLHLIVLGFAVSLLVELKKKS